jgi:apolipoprotein N-acyltransferase
MTAIGFSWVSYTVHEFGHFPWVFAILVQLVFCMFANLYIPLSGLAWLFFCRHARVRGPARLIALPIFMNVGERIFPMIFDFHFGYVWLWAGWPAFQLADICGFIGLSLIGLGFNAVFLHAYLNWKNGKRWWPAFLSVPVIFLLLNVWGHFHKQGLEKPDASAKFLIVQANIGNQEKLEAEAGSRFRDVVIDRFVGLTRQGLEKYGHADFAVWPETAFPEVIDEPTMSGPYPFKLRQYVSAMNTKLITGGYGVMPEQRRFTNSFFILDEQGRWITKPYHKTVLLAFGEYLPFADWIPHSREFLPMVADFGRGPGPTVLEAAGYRIGAQICYEGLFDWFTRGLADKGAQIIVNLTNDSWYGKYQEPWEHGWMTLAHAVEVRRPLVRSTNTGISTVILANGDILPHGPLHEEWFYLYDVPFVKDPKPTMFTAWGHWVFPVLMLLALILVALKGRSFAQKPDGQS